MQNLDPSTIVSGAPRAGDILAGKYRIERVLGSGGMGLVLEATHLELEQRVAIKLLLPQVAHSPESVERFSREARYAAKIKSEHVVRVLDVARLDSGSPYIVMEYLDGQDLADLVSSRGPLPVPLAVDLLLQACEAIAEAHALGIVHRDLKPANLFVVERPGTGPFVKVLDFGISKDSSRGGDERRGGITTTTAILGTPSYMSPEQMRSTRDVDGRADVWSLGAILFSLLKGEPPYQGESTADVCAKIMRDAPPPLAHSEAPRGIAYAIERCLEKSPDKRFENVAILAASIVEFGSPAARASLARIGDLPPPRSRLPSTPLESDPTSPAHVVVKKPSSVTRTAGTWERNRASTGSYRRRPLVNAALAVLAAAVIGGVVSLQIWGGKSPAASVSTGAPSTASPIPSPTQTASVAPPVSPTATASVPSVDVTALPLAPPSAVVTTPRPSPALVSPPAGGKPGQKNLFDDRK